MPIVKLRSIEEMDKMHRELWCSRPDDTWFQRVGRLWRRSARLNPRLFPPGVYKYHRIEDAQAERELWLSEHIASLRRQRSQE